MLILALDSTAQTGSVALCDDERLIAEYTVNTGNTHSETLLPMVETVLRSTGHKAQDVDLFACTAGPGSFTGVRIGAATVKGLAFGRGKPCIGVSTLQALAYNGMLLDGILCPCMNARRSQVYNALFTVRENRLVRLCEDRALPITELGQELAACPAYAGQTVRLIGDGAKMTNDAWMSAGIIPPERVCCLPENLLCPNGYSIAQVARVLWQAGVCTTDAQLTPVYLRMSQAERTRVEAEAKKSSPNKSGEKDNTQDSI